MPAVVHHAPSPIHGPAVVRRGAPAHPVRPAITTHPTLAGRKVLPPHHGMTTRQFGLIVGAIVAAMAIGVGIIWTFGDARGFTPFAGATGSGEETTARRDTTTIYRDLKNGKLMVLEVDRDGARLKGTIDKKTLPMANENYGKPDPGQTLSENPNFDRVKALGSAFR